jgi:hypothetical protein
VDFAWWLVKRAAKPIIDFWNEGGVGAEWIVAMMIVIDVIISFVLGVNDNTPDSKFYFVFTGLSLLLFMSIGCFNLGKIINRLYLQYCDERPEKIKRKRTEAIDAFNDGYNVASDYLEELGLDEYFEESE